MKVLYKLQITIFIETIHVYYYYYYYIKLVYILVWVYDSPFRFLVIIGRLIVAINCNQWEINCRNQLQSMGD